MPISSDAVLWAPCRAHTTGFVEEVLWLHFWICAALAAVLGLPAGMEEHIGYTAAGIVDVVGCGAHPVNGRVGYCVCILFLFLLLLKEYKCFGEKRGKCGRLQRMEESFKHVYESTDQMASHLVMTDHCGVIDASLS